jgi:hypothetical protein
LGFHSDGLPFPCGELARLSRLLSERVLAFDVRQLAMGYRQAFLGTLRSGRFERKGDSMGQLFRLGIFAVFVLIGATVRFGPPKLRRRAVGLLVGYIAFVHTAVLLAEREAWPFVNYKILHGQADLDNRMWRLDFFGVDAAGRKWLIDPYSFEPLHKIPLQSWVRFYVPLMPKANKTQAMAFLLQKAENARQRLAERKFIGYERYIGPAAAPYWYLLPRNREVSAQPYRELRIDLVEWTWHEAMSIPPREHRYLLTDYRQ